MADLLTRAVDGVKSFFGGVKDMATSLTEPAKEVVPPVLSADETKKVRKILEKANEQSKNDKEKFDKFVKQYRDGILQTDTNTPADWVKANQVFPYVNVLLSLLYHQDPQIAVEPRLEAGSQEQNVALLAGLLKKTPEEIRKMYAETLQNVETYSYEHTHSEIQNNACLFEALTRGLGWTVSSFDPVLGTDRTDALRRDEIFVDPHARIDPNQGEYIVQICVDSLEKAKAKFTAIEEAANVSLQEVTNVQQQNAQSAADAMAFGFAPPTPIVPPEPMYFAKNGDFDPMKIEANWMLSQDDGLTGEKGKKNDPASAKDCYRYFMKWTKDGESRWLDYFDGQTKDHLFRTEWPFKLAYEEFPYEELAFSRQYTQVCDAFPDLQVVESLWRLYEYLVEYFHRHVKRSIAKKIVYDRSIFTDEDIAALEDPVDMKFVGAQKVDGRDLAELIKVIDFNSGNDNGAAELAKAVKAIAEAILGLDEIQKGGAAAQKEITATHAEILDEYGRLRLGRRQKLVDNWLSRQCRHRIQIARQLVAKEKVQLIAGNESAEIWATMSHDPVDLVGEYTVGIIAGSAGERAQRAKLQLQQQVSALMMQINEAKGYEAFDMLAYAKDQMRTIGEKKPEQYQLQQPPAKPDEDEQPFKIDASGVQGLNMAVQTMLLKGEEARKVICDSAGIPYTPMPVPVNPFPATRPDVGVSVNVSPDQQNPPAEAAPNVNAV